MNSIKNANRNLYEKQKTKKGGGRRKVSLSSSCEIMKAKKTTESNLASYVSVDPTLLHLLKDLIKSSNTLIRCYYLVLNIKKIAVKKCKSRRM